MKRKIKFSSIIKDEVYVRNIEELSINLDLDRVMSN